MTPVIHNLNNELIHSLRDWTKHDLGFVAEDNPWPTPQTMKHAISIGWKSGEHRANNS